MQRKMNVVISSYAQPQNRVLGAYTTTGSAVIITKIRKQRKHANCHSYPIIVSSCSCLGEEAECQSTSNKKDARGEHQSTSTEKPY